MPDLLMSYEYRVNKDDFVNNENSLIIGESLTLMPIQESSNLEIHLCRIMEKTEKNKKKKMKNEWWVY